MVGNREDLDCSNRILRLLRGRRGGEMAMRNADGDVVACAYVPKSRRRAEGKKGAECRD